MEQEWPRDAGGVLGPGTIGHQFPLVFGLERIHAVGKLAVPVTGGANHVLHRNRVFAVFVDRVHRNDLRLLVEFNQVRVLHFHRCGRRRGNRRGLSLIHI